MTCEQPGGSCERPRRRQLMLLDARMSDESEPRKREHPRSDRRERGDATRRHECRDAGSDQHVDGRGPHLRVRKSRRASGNDRKATGRGDTDRLLTRGKLRRVSHRAEGAWDGCGRNVFGRTRPNGTPWRAKRDEPHGR